MMTALVKLITGYVLALLFLCTGPENNEPIRGEAPVVARRYQDAPGVFSILENKCNVCHKKRNRRRVFTPENMEVYKQDIYTQVFIKKRMPKGNSVLLTAKEQQELLTWISSTKIEHHGI